MMEDAWPWRRIISYHTYADPTIPVFMQNRRHDNFPPPGKTLITVSGNGAIEVVPEAEDEDEKPELS